MTSGVSAQSRVDSESTGVSPYGQDKEVMFSSFQTPVAQSPYDHAAEYQFFSPNDDLSVASNEPINHQDQSNKPNEQQSQDHKDHIQHHELPNAEPTEANGADVLTFEPAEPQDASPAMRRVMDKNKSGSISLASRNWHKSVVFSFQNQDIFHPPPHTRKLLAWALFVLLFSTLICCQATELIWAFLFHNFSNFTPPRFKLWIRAAG